MSRKYRAVVAIAAAFATHAALVHNADADVLISAPEPVIFCGAAIKTGIWYRPYPNTQTKRRRQVTIRAIDRDTGRVWWKKTATATQRWRHWYLPSGRRGRCGPTTITYTYRPYGRWIVDRYPVRFRGGD